MIRRLSYVVAPFLLVACGGHPLAGNWSQDLGEGKQGMSLTFEVGGERILVHTAPDAEGHHDHLDGTYTFDAASRAVTVQARLGGDGQPGSWTGAVDGDHLELGAADTKLSFHRGADPHGH